MGSIPLPYTEAPMTEQEQFLSKHPGLKQALQQPHPTIQDIARRLERYGSLSDKQVAFVLRLAAQGTEVHVPVSLPANPEERVTFTGTLVSAKHNNFGRAVMTVRVPAEGGTWLAYGTCPQPFLDTVPCGKDGRFAMVRGAKVEVTARLKPGRDEYFALMQRPSARVVVFADGSAPGQA